MKTYAEIQQTNVLTNGEDDVNLKNVRKAEREISEFIGSFIGGKGNKENRGNGY
jgi:hypothetical protein